MLAVLQTIAGGYTNQELKSYDIEYLAYQILKKHSATAIVNMDTQTLNKEINNIIRGNNNGSKKITESTNITLNKKSVPKLLILTNNELDIDIDESIKRRLVYYGFN